MKKYRLKDQELQRKLDEISNGDFSRNLTKAVKQTPKGKDLPILVEFHGFGQGNLRRFYATLEADEIEEIDEPEELEPFPGRFYTCLMEDGKCIFARRGFELDDEKENKK